MKYEINLTFDLSHRKASKINDIPNAPFWLTLFFINHGISITLDIPILFKLWQVELHILIIELYISY